MSDDPDSNLVNFAYSSFPAGDLAESALRLLLRQIWTFNTRNHLTGELRYADGRFIQVLEGACDVLLPLASRVLGDRRHGAIIIDAFRPIAARQFGCWSSNGFDIDMTQPGITGPVARNVVRLPPVRPPHLRPADAEPGVVLARK